jgi:AcrR family transcriptional regulator
MTRSQTQPSDATNVRDKLLAATEKVVTREGVANLTLDAVAREAGVSKGGLLYHFPSKRDLITAFVEGLASHCDQEHAKALESASGAPGEFTRAYLNIRLRPLEAQEEVAFTALLTAAATDPHYLEPFRRRVRQWQDRLESDGIDPATATIVRLAIDGLCLGELLGVPKLTPDRREQVIQKLLDLIAASTE